jgi:hypothetical protein
MPTICVNVPARLKEGLKIKAMELNVNTSDIIREALWCYFNNCDSKMTTFSAKKSVNTLREKALEEQLYFIRSVVENIAFVMDGGGEDFLDKCHLHTEKLLRKVRSLDKN